MAPALSPIDRSIRSGAGRLGHRQGDGWRAGRGAGALAALFMLAIEARMAELLSRAGSGSATSWNHIMLNTHHPESTSSGTPWGRPEITSSGNATNIPKSKTPTTRGRRRVGRDLDGCRFLPARPVKPWKSPRYLKASCSSAGDQDPGGRNRHSSAPRQKASSAGTFGFRGTGRRWGDEGTGGAQTAGSRWLVPCANPGESSTVYAQIESGLVTLPASRTTISLPAH